MFRKAHDVGVSSSSLLRNKEGRAARDAAAKSFPGVSEAQLDALLPAKAGIESVKLSSKLLAYGAASDHVPTFIDLDPKAPLRKLMPTIYGLWRAPSMLPTLLVPSQVSGFVIGGADLMLPGVYVPRGSGLPPFEAGQLVALRVAGNPLPFAVGEALVSSAAALSSGMRGRGVRVLHSYRDELWAYGGRGVPNAGFSAGIVRPIGPEPGLTAEQAVEDENAQPAPSESPVAAAEGENASTETSNADGAFAAAASSNDSDNTGRNNSDGTGAEQAAPSAAASSAVDSPPPSFFTVAAPSASPVPSYPWESWDADTLLTATLFQALRKHVTSADMPMLANVLYGTHMMAARPAGTNIDPKKSRWKKISAFLTHMASPEMKVLAIEENKAKGTLTVIGFDKHHPLLRAHRPWPPALEAAGASTVASGDGGDDDFVTADAPASTAVMAPGAPSQPYAPPTITEFVRPSSTQERIFRFVALEAIKARKMPVGRLPPRSSAKRRPGEDTFSSSGDGDGSSRTFDPTTALRLATDVSNVLFTRSEAGSVLQSYVALRSLPAPRDKRKVLLDPWLADALTGQHTHKDAKPAVSSSSSAAAASASGGLSASDFPSLGPAVHSSSKSAGVADDGSSDDENDEEGEEEEDEEAAAVEAALSRLSLSVPQPPPISHDGLSSSSGAYLPREDVTAAWAERLQSTHTIEFPATGDTLLRRGPPPPVQIFVRRLQGGRKHTTHVQGYEYYRLPPDQLVRECSRLFAASATTQPASNNPTIVEVFIQGDVAEAVAGHLASRYGIPRKYLAVTEA